LLWNNFAGRGIYTGMDADATLTVDPATLPDEPAVLKQLVVQLFEELQKRFNVKKSFTIWRTPKRKRWAASRT
jgi:hypothetical protein